MEQSSNSRAGVPRLSQSTPVKHAKETTRAARVRLIQLKRAARAQARDKRALPAVVKVARAGQARQI